MKMKSNKKKAKIKKKALKAAQGAISLMLCILITPFLSMAGALIELSRYQSSTEILQEVIDSSMLSVLAGYDEYLEDRFGLFAVSQDTDMNEDFNNYISRNSKILGGAVSVDSASLNGKYSLSTNGANGSYDVLASQILDFSETTVITEMMLENFKLQELIDKLKDITGFSNLTGLADKVKNVTSAVKDLISSAENLYKSADTVVNDINAVIDSVDKISSTLLLVYNDIQKDLDFDISQYNITVDQDKGLILEKINPTGEDDDTIDIIAELKNSDYRAYFNTIKTNVTNIKNHIRNLNTEIQGLSDKFSSFKDSLEKTKTAIDGLSEVSGDYASSGDEQKENAAESTKTMQDVYNEIISDFEKLLNDTAEELFNNLGRTFNEVADSFKTDVFNALDFNINSIPSDTYETIVEYFKSGEKLSVSGFMNYFLKNNAINDLESKIKSFPANLKKAANDAVDKMKEQFKEQIINSLRAIASAIENLFGIDGLYNKDLNAYLGDSIYSKISPEGEERSAFEKFLDGINKLIESINGLTPNIDWASDPFGALKTALESIFGIFKAVSSILDSIVTLVADYIKKITDFVSDFGNISNFYDFFLIAGYMLHNLPNRIDYNSESALTGFEYKNIPKDTSTFGKIGLEGTGLDTIQNYIGGVLDSESGGNQMFKGAETEYIVAGTRSEVMNQVVTFMQIYILRLLLDLPAVFTDKNVSLMADSAGLFAWIVYLVVMIAEPLCDTVILVNNGNSYLIKENCYISPVGLPKLITELGELGLNKSITEALKNNVESDLQKNGASKDWSKSGSIETDYQDHLLIVLAVFVRKNQMLTRFADVVELEASMYYKDSSFDINKAYTCVSCNADVTYYPLISIFESAGLTTFSVEYEQDRSY